MLLINFYAERLIRETPKEPTDKAVRKIIRRLRRGAYYPPLKVKRVGDKYIYKKGIVRVTACDMLCRPIVCNIVDNI